MCRETFAVNFYSYPFRLFGNEFFSVRLDNKAYKARWMKKKINDFRKESRPYRFVRVREFFSRTYCIYI